MPKETQDFIDFEPERIKLISKETMALAREYLVLIRALADGSKTVKELHGLYKDPNTEIPAITIKTVYRYLEKLEKAELVTVAGHRATQGSRIPEKLYSRTARIFFQQLDDAEWESSSRESAEAFSAKLATLLKEYFQQTATNISAFDSVFEQFFGLRSKTASSLLKKTEESDGLAELYVTTDFDKISTLNEYGLMFITFLQHPEILEQLKDLLAVEK
ncbi:MAG: hypothetical protein ACE5OZ_16375 [Candidatus Heimdallarchaeota archaeon]